MSEDDLDEREDSDEEDTDSDEDLVRRLKAWEASAKSHYSQWRDEARICYDFVAGNQWTPEDKSQLLEEMRAPIVFNRTGPMVDAVIGAEILNRQEVRYLPREVGDVQVNEVITAAADWARETCDAEDEESDAFYDTVVCGMGWTETRMDYEIDPEGTVRIDRVDPFEMWGDPNAKKRNLADARFVLRARYMTKDELPAEWKSKIVEGEEDADLEDPTSSISSRGDDYADESDDTGKSGEKTKGRAFIRHFQWWELEDGYKLTDEATGQVATMDEEKYRALVELFLKNGMQPPESAKIKVRQYYQAFLCGSKLLEEKAKIPCNRFTLNCITGKRDRNAGTWFGIVRAMRDPQMWANKWLSQILHILNTSAKGGLMYEKGAFANPRKAMEEWAKPDGGIEVERGALSSGAIQERKAANYPDGLDKLMEFAVNSMPQVTGINLELLGLVQKEQAGVLEAQRKQAGYAILAVFFDSLRRYRKMQGRVMLHYIQHYLSDGRLVRIMGNNGAEQYVPLVKQKDTATYDVVVDEAPMSANQKEAVWGMMVQMLPILGKQPMPAEVWGEFLRYSPLPSSVSTKIGQAMANAEQAAAQAAQNPPPDPKTQAIMMKAQIDGQARSEQMQMDRERHQNEMAARGQDLEHRAASNAMDLEHKAATNVVAIEAAKAKAQMALRSRGSSN